MDDTAISRVLLGFTSSISCWSIGITASVVVPSLFLILAVIRLLTIVPHTFSLRCTVGI